MIVKMDVVSDLLRSTFLSSLGRIVSEWQNQGLTVDIQYSVMYENTHTALVIGKK